MSQAALSNGEIFIVDDDPAIRQMLSIVFAEAGFHATCFAEGGALLASTRTVVPACIILDVNIPGRSGLDILKQLNAEDYPAPIFCIRCARWTSMVRGLMPSLRPASLFEAPATIWASTSCSRRLNGSRPGK